MMRGDDALSALVEKHPLEKPKYADLLRFALDVLAIEDDDATARLILLSILLFDDLAETIYGRL